MRTWTIEQHLSGRQHNHRFIRRIFVPEDLGERLRPFVFGPHPRGDLDGGGFGFHPHLVRRERRSFQQSIDIDHEDTTGQKASSGRGIEYVQAGEFQVPGQPPIKQRRLTGFQLWLSPPPELKEGRRAEYLSPEAVPQKDPDNVVGE